MGCAFGKPPTREDEGGAIKAPAAEIVGKVIVPPYVAAAPGSVLQWPVWLTEVAGEAIRGWAPRRADSFQKLAKVGIFSL